MRMRFIILTLLILLQIFLFAETDLLQYSFENLQMNPSVIEYHNLSTPLYLEQQRTISNMKERFKETTLNSENTLDPIVTRNIGNAGYYFKTCAPNVVLIGTDEGLGAGIALNLLSTDINNDYLLSVIVDSILETE